MLNYDLRMSDNCYGVTIQLSFYGRAFSIVFVSGNEVKEVITHTDRQT